MNKWERWFAWYPVLVIYDQRYGKKKYRIEWLTTIFRRRYNGAWIKHSFYFMDGYNQ